ncbi:MAG: efflux RND transporter permease subunit [Rhodothermales bacterium]
MKIIELSTRRRVTIAMFTVAVLLFGTVSLGRLKVNLLPDLTYPTLTIRTEYAGAAPVEIENLVTKPIEEALGVVKNVNEVRSISRSGQSDVVLEFAWGTDMDYASLDVREKLDALQLPLEIQRPVILRFDPTLDPIMRFGLFTKTSDDDALRAEATPVEQVALARTDDTFDENRLKYLRRFADEQLKKELESALGVAAVKISGGLEDEVQVLVDQEKLGQIGLPIERVVQVLGAENVNLSGGRLEEGTQQYLVRTVNQFQTVEEIGNVIVDQQNRRPIYLRDIATVRLGFKEREAITRINGVEAVEVAIYKEGDANTVAVARAVESRLAFIRNDLLPDDMNIVDVYNQSTFITQAVNEVRDAGIIGGILAIIILYFFLRNFGTTLIISLSIPVSVIATFNLMYGYDLTLNIMSLGGLALGIGLLLDNSIVVLENIARHREMGKSVIDAARDGASGVGMAVVASTLTTVAVFFPLVFVQGIAGQLFRDQALTVTFSLLASLIVAITLIPMLASLGKRGDDREAAPELKAPTSRVGRGVRKTRLVLFTSAPTFFATVFYRFFRGIGRLMRWLLTPLTGGFNLGYEALARRYPPMVSWALDHKGIVLGLAFTMFAGTMLLIPGLGLELIPQLTQDELDLEFRLAPGTPLEQTDGILKRVQQTATNVPNIRTTFAVAGTGNRMDANPDQGGENWGELHVTLTPGSREAGEQSAMTALRRDLERMPGLQYKFGRPTLFTFKTPIEIEIAGYDLDKLKRTSQTIAEKLSESDRFADVKSTMERGHPEVRILFDRERAAALGLAVHELADRVVSQVRGDVATRYSWNDRKIDVLVRAREEDRVSIQRIRRLVINPESERPIPLEAVADVVVDEGPGEIRRVGQQRVAMVTANLTYGDLGSATEEIDRMIDTTPTPSGVVLRQAGQSEEMAASFRSLLLALTLAVFLVYLVMASQFESLIHPFVIFFSIPLALIGAVLALWLTGSTISVVVFIGAILLVGIVVNNAIVLVDLVNQLRAQGTPKREAIVEAGRLRLRPILMTTLTTTLGLLPLAIGLGNGAELRAPMAITVIGGLVVSTLLTLVVIPVMYAILDRRPDVAPAAP